MSKPHHLTSGLYDALRLSNADLGLIIGNAVLADKISEFAKANCEAMRKLFEEFKSPLPPHKSRPAQSRKRKRKPANKPNARSVAATKRWAKIHAGKAKAPKRKKAKKK